MMEVAPLAFVELARHVRVAAGAALAFDKLARRHVRVVDRLDFYALCAHSGFGLHVGEALSDPTGPRVVGRLDGRWDSFGRFVHSRLGGRCGPAAGCSAAGCSAGWSTSWCCAGWGGCPRKWNRVGQCRLYPLLGDTNIDSPPPCGLIELGLLDFERSSRSTRNSISLGIEAVGAPGAGRTGFVGATLSSFAAHIPTARSLRNLDDDIDVAAPFARLNRRAGVSGMGVRLAGH